MGKVTNHGRPVGHITFNVADTGKTLAMNSGLDDGVESRIDYHGSCSTGALHYWGLAGPGVFARSGGGRMRITASGRLSFRDTHNVADGTRAITLAGGFNGDGRTASGVFKVTGRHRGGQPCTSGRIRFNAHFTGQRHFLHGTCDPPKTRTLAQSSNGRIYEQRYIGDDGSHDNTAAYGCLTALHKRFFLAFTDNYYFQYAGNFTLAGSFAAFSDGECPGECGWGVEVVDLSTGLFFSGWDASPQLNLAEDEPTDLVLASDGAIAWISCDDSCEVDKLDGPQPTPLDAGDPKAIDQTSLTLNGTTLSWRNNGETKTATLN